MLPDASAVAARPPRRGTSTHPTAQRLSPRSRRLGRALGALLAALGAGPACAAAPPALAVVTAPVVLAPVPHWVRVLGEVDSLGKTTLVAPATGKVVGPFLAEGEVPAGAVLARNVPATLQSALAGARADLAYARAAEARTQQLVVQRLRTRIALDQARRNLAEAEGRLEGLRREAAQQVIKAPFAGTLHYLIAPGTVVYKGTPIASLSGRATPWIDARLTPEAARGIRSGDGARISGSGWSGTARVVSVGHDARPLGLVRVRLDLPPDNALVPGEWVWVRLSHPGPPAPAVPRAAVLMRGARSIVFVLDAGRVHAVTVKVVAATGRRDWLAGPLHPGERVAVTHVTRLAEGSRIALATGPRHPAR
jgi:membrane fusion protein, multidrug efflux system